MDIADIGLSVIVAMTPGRVIGNKGDLLWERGQLPSDMGRFVEKTLEAGVMVMGFKTYASIINRNRKPLSGRKHIVLTKKNISSPYESVHFVNSVEEALVKIAEYGGRAYVIGGGEIFEIFLPLPQMKMIYVTIVHMPEVVRGDAYFPELSADWRCVGNCPIRLWNPKDKFPTSFEMYERY